MDDKIIIIDESNEEETLQLSPEEIEEMQRNERLKKIFKKKKKYNTTIFSNLSKIINVVALFGIAVGMLLESGIIAAVCLGVIFVSCIANYIFFK